MKDAISDGLKVYFKDFQGECKELRFSEVNLTPIFRDYKRFRKEMRKRIGEKAIKQHSRAKIWKANNS